MPAVLRAILIFPIFLLFPASPVWAQTGKIPAELMEDDHFLEEFGVNNLTTPSIGKIFDQLQRFGDLPYEKLKRDVPDKTPSDRTLLAMSLGSLIADGFFVVHTEKLNDLEPIGRAILKHASALGAGAEITSHAKPLIEHSQAGDLVKLRKELVETQKDVQVEMVTLRDVDAVHLIGFGGWLRAFEVACAGSLEPFSPEKAEILKRVDIADYYVAEFETLEPRILELDHVKRLRALLQELKDLVDVPDEEVLTEERVTQMHAKVSEMTALAFPSK